MGELMIKNVLFETICDAVREKARALPGMKNSNGSVRIAVTPLTKDADDLFGGLGKFDRRTKVGPTCVSLPDDIVRYDVVYDLFPGKASGTIFSYPTSLSRAVAVTVQKKTVIGPTDDTLGKVMQFQDWARFEICVSGANKTDEAYTCASVSTWAIQKFFKDFDSSNYAIKGPEYKV